MSRTGTINVVDENYELQLVRRYFSLPKAMSIICDLQKYYKVRMEQWFIHAVPDPIEIPDMPLKTKTEDMSIIKVTDEHKAFIQANMDSKTPHEMSLEIELSREAIRYWMNKFRVKPFGHITLPEFVEPPKKVEPRPPAKYSNYRPYADI